MRVRHLVREPKEIQSDTNWKTEDLTRRYAPIFPRTTPIRGGWRWRSARAIGLSGNFVLLAKCNPARDNWQAILMALCDEGNASAVARFEQHSSHPGLHSHAHCERGGLEMGPSSLDDLVRVPRAGTNHRRNNAWSEGSFWEAAKSFFRVQEKTGPLL